MLTGASRSAVAAQIDAGLIRVDDTTVQSRSQRVSEGQVVDCPDPDVAEQGGLAPEPDVDVEVIHADTDVIVVDKAAGQVVHPGSGNETGTIVQGLLARFPEIAGIGEPQRPGIVHRLDKGTTGVFVVARSSRAYAGLSAQLRNRSAGRRYLTWAWGRPENDTGLIDAPIARAIRDPTRMSVRDDGKPARTRYVVEARWRDRGVVRLGCRLETGRTHQIRVHLDAIRLPVVGDPRYGQGRDPLGLDRPALHAVELTFTHPADDRPRTFESPLPSDLRAMDEELGPPDVPML